MVCGEALVYLETNRDHTCHYCGLTMPANALCAAGHFVCDVCHGKAALDILKQVCLHSREPDAVALMQRIRSHPHFPVHGPEHHSLVPAVILAALRNAGEEVSEAHILTGIERGANHRRGRLRILRRLRRGHRGGNCILGSDRRQSVRRC